MGKVTIVNKQGLTMKVPERLAAKIGGVKPKILDKPPDLEVIAPLDITPEPIRNEPINVEPVKAQKVDVNDDIAEVEKIEPLAETPNPRNVEKLAEPKPVVKPPVKKNVAGKRGGRR